LAEKKKITTYDASYLWVSQQLGGELVTLDERLLAAAK
jgi:predicted nucleic acid-binding protein